MFTQINSHQEYLEIHKRSIENPEEFWSGIATDFLWKRKWNKVLKWDFKKAEVRWFSGGKLNITENCLDRHLKNRGDQVAIIWEPNNPSEDTKEITYAQLHREACKFANVLKENGIQKGDRICIYMPMVPELAVAMLGCARIGAVHSIVFAGFSSTSLSDRINDAACKMVITSDGSFRGNKTVPLKEISDEALSKCKTVERVIVLKRTGQQINWFQNRDIWWHEAMQGKSDTFDAVETDSEDLLFILYTSGSTGKPKGMVHTVAGYMVYTTYTFLTAFQYKEKEIFWCTADIGWITGHSYIVYGPLSAGATSLMFEGIPSWPDMGRFWDVVDKHKVNIFYTAPTAIRALEKADLRFVQNKNLSSLRVLGTVGEPINEEAWYWYDNHVGKNKCPIVDTYWQTETGGFMISPIAGATKLKPAFASFPMPGIQPAIMDDKGNELHGNNIEGRLAIKFPWPSIARTIYGDHERFRQTYFSTFKNMYFTGDGVKKDDEGYYRITGRVDDIIIVSGHNLGTAEIENAIDEHAEVCETAVVGYPHDIKGQGIYAYVILYDHEHDQGRLRKEILDTVSKTIGPIAKPDKIQFVSGLPKTRSGKIMRRILKKIASGETANLGDVSTLLDPSVVEEIKQGAV
jgi:acetyl-CoA synthetase